MRIEVLGGGPSGLYFAYLARLRLPGVRVVVHERNAPDATFGFGVVLAERGLENLAAADADSCARVRAIAKSLGDQQIVLEGVPVSIEGAEYGSAVPRLALLGTLQGLCDEVGVEQRFGDEIADPASLEPGTRRAPGTARSRAAASGGAKRSQPSPAATRAIVVMRARVPVQPRRGRWTCALCTRPKAPIRTSMAEPP